MSLEAPETGAAARGPSESAADVLRELSLVLLDDLDRIAGRLTMMVLNREPSYAELGHPCYDDVHRNLRDNIERGIQSLARQVPNGTDPQDTSKRTGRLRARQGVPLEAVLRAYRLGGQVIWEELRAASAGRFDGRYDAALLDAAGYVWRVIDASSSALVDAYRKEESRVREQELSRRHMFVEALLSGRGAEPALAEEAAAALGLPVHGAMLCAVALVDFAGDEPIRAPGGALRARGIDSCWHVRAGDVVGLIALGENSVESACEALRPGVLGRAGLSPVVAGLAEIGVGFAMAGTAARTLAEPGLACLDERLPEALLADRPELRARLSRVAFEGLDGLSEPERKTILETVRAVIACNGSPTYAARRLYCHRNTVIYRMHKFEELTGHSIARPRERLLLNLALLAGSDG